MSSFTSRRARNCPPKSQGVKAGDFSRSQSFSKPALDGGVAALLVVSAATIGELAGEARIKPDNRTLQVVFIGFITRVCRGSGASRIVWSPGRNEACRRA